MTSKEKEILEWEFEEMLRNLVSAYLKLNKNGIGDFITSIDTHEEIKVVYDIRITKRGFNIGKTQKIGSPQKIGCFNCKYYPIRYTEAPCKDCEKIYSKWEGK